VSDCAQYCETSSVTIDRVSQEARCPLNQTDHVFLSEGLPRTGGSRPLSLIFLREIRNRTPSSGGHFVQSRPNTKRANWRCKMRSRDLMKPDLLSDIVLLGFGALMLLSLFWFVVSTFDRI